MHYHVCNGRLPLAVDIIVCKKDVWGFIRWSCLSAVATLVRNCRNIRTASVVFVDL